MYLIIKIRKGKKIASTRDIEDPVESEYYKWLDSQTTKNIKNSLQLICFTEVNKH